MANAKTQNNETLDNRRQDHVIFSLHTKQNIFDPNFINPYFLIKVILTPHHRIIYTNFPEKLIEEGQLIDYLKFIRTGLNQEQVQFCKKNKIDLIDLPHDYEYPQEKQILFDHCNRRYDYTLCENNNLEFKNVGKDFLLICDLIPDSWFKTLKTYNLGQGGKISDFQKIVLYKLIKEINDGNYIK